MNVAAYNRHIVWTLARKKTNDGIAVCTLFKLMSFGDIINTILQLEKLPYDYRSKTNQKWIKSSTVFSRWHFLFSSGSISVFIFVGCLLLTFKCITIIIIIIVIIVIPILMVVWIFGCQHRFPHLEWNNAGGSCVHKCVFCMSPIDVIFFSFSFHRCRIFFPIYSYVDDVLFRKVSMAIALNTTGK